MFAFSYEIREAYSTVKPLRIWYRNVPLYRARAIEVSPHEIEMALVFIITFRYWSGSQANSDT